MSCPVCAKKIDPQYRPFCSRRCADVDLGKWLTESYAIPAVDNEDDGFASEDEAPPSRPQ